MKLSTIETLAIAPIADSEVTITLDDAIDRLAAIQAQERIVGKEKKELRKLVEAALRDNKIKTHSTNGGHTATVFDKVSKVANKAYIESLLTDDQLLEAYPLKTSRGMKIS
jgi:hypothetical protein